MKNKLAILSIIFISILAIAYNARGYSVEPDLGIMLGATTLKVPNGGTGANTFTKGGVVIGNNRNALVATSSLYVTDNGNVGIGTTTPDDKLTVTGDINANGLFLTPQTAPAHQEGFIYYDSTKKMFTGYVDEPDVAMNFGEEMWKRVANDTGSTITNGSVVYISGASTTADVSTVALAQANNPTMASRVLGIATHDIESGTIGRITFIGDVGGINTAGLTAGDRIWLSATVPGGYTTTRPSYPNYIIELGQVGFIDAADGVLAINVIGTIDDIISNDYNGIFLETINFTVSSDGSVTTGSLQNASSTQNLTMRFSDGYFTLDTTPATTTVLTPGTATIPATNYVYIPVSTKFLTVSTTGFPTDEEHIKVADLILRDSASTQTYGALGNRNWNDHLADSQDGDSQGHRQDVSERIRQIPAEYDSGITTTMTITTNGAAPDNVDVSTTAGVVYQMHRQTWTAKDSAVSDDFHVVNNNASPYAVVSDLNTQLTDADGDSMSGRVFNLVLWGVQNKTGQPSHFMVNLPTCSYSVLSNALNDINSCDVTSIPPAFKGKGFLIAKFTLSHSVAGGGTWTLEQQKDLRGVLPAAVGGGSTVTSIVNFPDSSFTVFDNLDATKIMALQLSGITTGNTRTLTVQDSDGTIAYLDSTMTGVWNGTAIDISDYTNLGVISGSGLVLTGDDIGVASGYEIPLTASTTLWNEDDRGLSMSSTTLDYLSNSFSTGTSTWPVINYKTARTIKNLYCKTRSTGTVLARCGDGTNWTEQIVCSSTGQADDGSITNGSFTAREDFICEVGSQIGDPDWVTITPTFDK